MVAYIITLREPTPARPVLQAVDRVLREAGLAAAQLPWLALPSPEEEEPPVIAEHEEVPWPPSESDLLRGSLLAAWFGHPHARALFCLQGYVTLDEGAMTGELKLGIDNFETTKSAFDSEEIEILRRMDYVIVELHRALDARESAAWTYVGSIDDSVVVSRLADDSEWTPLGELLLDEYPCHCHLLEWAIYPDRLVGAPVDQDTDYQHPRYPWESAGYKRNVPPDESWRSDPRIPVVFDQEHDDIQLVLPEGEQALARHCLVCGDGLPRSPRDDQFHVLTPEELHPVRLTAWQSYSVADLTRAFGQPDLTVPGLRNARPWGRRTPNEFDIECLLVYANAIPKAALLFRITPDGYVMMDWLGLRKSESNR